MTIQRQTFFDTITPRICEKKYEPAKGIRDGDKKDPSRTWICASLCVTDCDRSNGRQQLCGVRTDNVTEREELAVKLMERLRATARVGNVMHMRNKIMGTIMYG